MRCRTIVSGLVAVALLACAPAFAAEQQDADTKELAAYRLSRDGLDKYAAVLRALAVELRKDPRFQEMAKIEAEIERLQDKDDPTDAELKQLETLQERLEQLDEATSLSMDQGSLDDIEAHLRKHPAMAAAIEAGGLTAREYAKFTLVLFQAAMVAGMQKAGVVKELPKEIAAENVQFVQQHEQELLKLQKEMEALKPGGRER